MLIKDCKSCPLSKVNQYPPYEKYCGHPDGGHKIGDDLNEQCPLKEGALVLTTGDVMRALLKELSKKEGRFKVVYDLSTNKYVVKNEGN